MRNLYMIVAIAFLSFSPGNIYDTTTQSLPFSQNWSNTALITLSDDWSGVPGVEGYLGQDITTGTGTDPQTLLGVSAIINDLSVLPNQGATTSSAGDVGEFEIANPTIGLQGSGTADAPHVIFYLNATGLQNITVAYNVRDLDASADNAVQQVALHYRVGSTGNFTNVPAAYIADATTGPSIATLVTPIGVALPAACDNQPLVQVRVMTTNAVGNDEWVGIDDIVVTGLPLGGNTITTGAVSTPPFCVDGSTSAAGTVAYTSTGTYAGSTFTALLSDATGSFGSPTSIGSDIVNGTDPSGSINVTVPAGTASGTGYRIRIDASSPSVTGSESAAFTIINGANDVNPYNAAPNSGQVTLTWTNPSGCFDEVLFVAASGSTNTGTPTGDGSAYTGNLIFGLGTALGNGFVVYKGSTSPQSVTALTNGTVYFFKAFTRRGTNWSSGVEISTTPAATSSATDFFRSVASGNWNDPATWESSPDNSVWIPATLSPDLNANTITIRNGHTVTNSANGLSTDQTIIDAGGLLTIATGVTWALANGTGTDLVVNGTLLNQGGTWTISGSAWQVNSAGTYIHNTTAGIATPLGASILDNNSNFIYRGNSGLIPAISTSGRVYGNLSFESTAGSWTAGASGAGTLTINGNFLIGANVTYSTTQTGLMTFAGNFTNNGTLTNGAGTQLYLFTGVSKTIGGSSVSTFESITINVGASASITLNITIAAGFAFTINGSFEAGFNQVLGGGAVLINGYAGVESLGGLPAMFANTGGLVLGASSTIEFKGTVGVQAITSRFDYANVIISGTASKTAIGNSFIAGTLTFVNTIITTNIVSVITLTSTANFVGASNASHIDGPAGRQTNSTSVYTFPVGDAGIFKPIDLIPASASLAVFGAEYHVIPPPPSPMCDPVRMQAYTNNEWWDIQRPFGTGDFSVRLNYSQASSNGTWFNGTSPMPDPDNSKAITVAHLTGGCWVDKTNTAGILLGDAVSGQVTSSVSATFGPYTFGYGPLAILPVNFGTVKAFEVGNSIRVEWNNLTESNVIDYKVEHSANGRDFTDIAVVPATVNNGGRADYYFIHQSPLSAINYYRIRSSEMNGISKQSIIVKVDSRPGITGITIYPNPVTSRQFSLQLTGLPKGQYTVRMFAANGQQVYDGLIVHSGGSITQMIQLAGTMKPGLYNLVISDGQINLKRSFILE